MIPRSQSRRAFAAVVIAAASLAAGGCVYGGDCYRYGYGGFSGYGAYGGHGPGATSGHVRISGTDPVFGVLLLGVAGGVAIFEAIFGCD